MVGNAHPTNYLQLQRKKCGQCPPYELQLKQKNVGNAHPTNWLFTIKTKKCEQCPPYELWLEINCRVGNAHLRTNYK